MAPNVEVKKYDDVVVVALLVALREKGGTLNPSLVLMKDLDGSRSTSSFEHSLRAANKLAASILAKKQAGQPITPADMGDTTAASTPTSGNGTPKSVKRSENSNHS
jgi:hypothetical protein